jgi:aryl-alcohol dehydrogenase-like predicted oxidoreductase
MCSAAPSTRGRAIDVLDAFIDHGINAIDTADVY